MTKKEIVMSVVKRIETKLQQMENISVDEVAAISGYSKRYMQKIFLEVIGMRISKYIKKRKLTQAAILIKLTKKSIYHIAMDLNYSTQQSFTRAFFQEFKVSPLQYRLKDEFDCSALFPNYALNLPPINIKKGNINHLKLKVESFQYQDSLLNDEYKSRANKIRFNRIMGILSSKDEAIVVSKFEPKSLLDFNLDLNVMVGYKDEKSYNYEIKEKKCWIIEYNGTWGDYIIFGRFFLCYCDISFDNSFIVEKIKFKGNNDSCEKIYNSIIYLPSPEQAFT
ncbi:TPA: helix-turn-helix domain-containing protein [Escherichia coli]|uniref:helix-turn-helix domain-containing protein n=1 Tax=Escherichia coli TaxID=562 RepID=UPI000E1D642E|nr:helix-turn-helix domain-containing protein [Escherichia coli]RDQ04432.1 Right origin-binding protein [Escherichia coli]RDQ53462.1 Right origin-binding protein [Escherichia coli]